MSARLSPTSRVVVIGGGPAGLMAAEVLATAGASVTVFERMPTVGRKLLLAGRGGLNLTHTDGLDAFLDRYGPARAKLAAAIESFDPDALRDWCAGLGEATFVGTSGRVFPDGFRATSLLRAWLARLDALGVDVRTAHTWQGWTDAGDALAFTDADGARVTVTADATVLALGGASWPRTGSDGAWVAAFEQQGIAVAPLRPANCGFEVAWSEAFRTKHAGMPLKNVALTFGEVTVRGEAMVQESGLEGGAVYELSARLREAIDREGSATITVDLQPDLTVEQLAKRLRGRRPKDSASNALRRAAGLRAVSIAVLREASGNDLPTDPHRLAALIKAAPLTLLAPQPIDRAISTAGGIELAELDDSYMLRRRPGTFVAGEMLDWEAPTGGYLLQATFATAVAAAHGAIGWLTRDPAEPGAHASGREAGS